jgi:hypothetical protein
VEVSGTPMNLLKTINETALEEQEAAEVLEEPMRLLKSKVKDYNNIRKTLDNVVDVIKAVKK